MYSSEKDSFILEKLGFLRKFFYKNAEKWVEFQVALTDRLWYYEIKTGESLLEFSVPLAQK